MTSEVIATKATQCAQSRIIGTAVFLATISALLFCLTSVARAEEVTGSITPTEQGTSRTISIPSPGQRARISVPVSAGESVSMVSSEASLSTGYRLEWLDPDSEYVRTWYPSGEADRFFEPVRFEEAGEATLLLEPEGTGTGSVTFTVYDASDKTASISLAGGGETKTFAIVAPGQRQLVDFEGGAGQHVSLLPSKAGFEGEFHVNTPAGELLEGSGGGLRSLHGPLTLPEAGAYVLVLTGDEGQTGSVDLNVKDPSLAVAYGFDEGEGSEAKDESGLDHDGEINGASWSPSARQAGWSLNFDGEEGCVDVHDSAAISLQGGFTVDAWVHPEARSEEEANQEITIFEVPASETAPAVALVVGRTDPRTYEAVIGEETVGKFAVAGDTEEVVWWRWQYVAMTFDGTHLRLYVDGELVGVTTVESPVASSGPMTVGCSRTSPNTFRGGIDELRVYTRALSGSELAEDQTNPVQPVHLMVQGPVKEAVEGGLVSFQDGIGIVAGARGESSVEAFEVKVDGQLIERATRAQILEEQGEEGEECSENICYLRYSLEPLFPPESESGEHTVTVIAIGDHGQEASYSKTVTVDASLPSLELSGVPYADHGQLTEESEQIHVLSSDGEGPYASGIQSISVYVDGEYVEGTWSPCEGGCASEEEATYTYSEETWGKGPHEMVITAVDGAGNEATQKIRLNQSMGSVEPTCESSSPKTYEEEPESTAAAVAAVEEILPAATEPASETGEGEYAEFDPAFAEGKSDVEESTAFMARGGGVGGRAGAVEASFTVGQGTCLSPLQSTSTESPGALIPGSGVIAYTNTAPETDTFIRNNGLGATVVESLRGPSAPSEFSWGVALEGDEELVELSGGGVAIVNPNGRDLSEVELPEGGAALEHPAEVADTEAVLDAAGYDLVQANDEVQGELISVIPEPVAVGSGSIEVPGATLAVDPSGTSVTVNAPPATEALIVRTVASPDMSAMCASAFESNVEAYSTGCEAEGGEGGGRPYITGMDWAPDGSFVYTAFWDEFEHYDLNPGESRVAPEETLYRSSSDGTDVEAIETPGFEVLGRPKVAPDGEHLAFNGCSLTSFRCGIVVTAANGEEGVLVASLPGPRIDDVVGFSADGSHVMYLGREVEVKGEVEYVEEQVFSVDLSGGEERQLTNIGTEVTSSVGGKVVAKTRGISTESPPAADPAGNSIALQNWREVREMPASGEKVPLSEMVELSSGEDPAYNPAGTKLVVSKEYVAGKGSAGIYQEKSNGSEQSLLVKTANKHEFRGIMPVFSPNGSQVAYISDGLIYTVPTAGGAPAVAVSGGTSGVPTLEQALEQAPSTLRTLAASVERAAVASSLESTVEGLFEEAHAVLKEVSGQQVEFCIAHWPECHSFFADRATALSAREALFTKAVRYDTSTMANAFQHGFWTTLMVRDSGREERDLPAGLWFAAALERTPYSWDSRQDLINDVVGYIWFLGSGVESHLENGVVVFHKLDKLQDCQGLLPKGKNAIFIGGVVDPFSWVKHHQYEFQRLIYRKLRSNKGLGPRVYPTGRTCVEAWSEISH